MSNRGKDNSGHCELAVDNGGKIMTYVFMLFAVVGAGFLFEIGRTLAKVVMEDWGVREWLTQRR